MSRATRLGAEEKAKLVKRYLARVVAIGWRMISAVPVEKIYRRNRMNTTKITKRRKDHGRIKAVVSSLLVLFLVGTVFTYTGYLRYIADLEDKIEVQKQEIIAYQDTLTTAPKSKVNVFAIVDGIKVQAVSMIYVSKDNILYEVNPKSKFLLEESISTLSEANRDYEILFSEYTLAENHIRNMDYFSYLKYKTFKNSN